jgi:hypothetical protein
VEHLPLHAKVAPIGVPKCDKTHAPNLVEACVGLATTQLRVLRAVMASEAYAPSCGQLLAWRHACFYLGTVGSLGA